MTGLRYLYVLFVCFILALLLLSCQNHDKVIAEKLAILEQSVDQNPDSALMILDSTINPFDLNESNHNKYLLLQIQAKDKSYKDITNDTVIFRVRDYYANNSDINNVALASLYCGRVFHEQGKNKAAMDEYQKTNKYASQTKNDNLKGLSQNLIGEISLKEYMHTIAIEHFKIASHHFRKAQNLKNEIISYELTGQAYLMDSKVDSALFYYDMGRQLAILTKNNLQLANIMHDIGNAYAQSGKYKKAISYFREAVKYGEICMSDNNKAKLYLNFARVFHHTYELDSAQIYIAKSLSFEKRTHDIKLLAGIYKTLSSMEENKGNLHLSLDYQKKYAETVASIVDENKNKEILELQKKYKDEHLLNEKNKLAIRSQKTLLFSSIVLLIICLIALYFYRKSVQKNRSFLKKENELLDAQSKIYQLLEMAKTYDEKDKNTRNVVLHHFDILRKAVTLENYLREDCIQDSRLIRNFNKIVYGEETISWEILYNTVNKIYNGLFEQIRVAYPSLNESELQICCLTYMNFSCSEIGVFVGLSTNTIHAKRSAIRKKLHIESQANIQEFLIKTFQ